jgi:hypothetical protein
VEAGAQGCKSNTNPLWAPILCTIKTKSAAAAAAAQHKTLGKHPERVANRRAGWGAASAGNERPGRRPQPCRWTGGGWQESKSVLKDWKPRGTTPGGTLGLREWRPGPKAAKQNPLHWREVGCCAAGKEGGWERARGCGEGGSGGKERKRKERN